MVDCKKLHIEEFFGLHSEELAASCIARTTLFSDYVAYCNERDYRHHSNLVEFCKAVDEQAHPTRH